MDAVFTDADGDNVQWTDENGLVSFTKLSNNGRIPGELKEWISAGNRVSAYIPPVRTDENKIKEALSETETTKELADKLEKLIIQLDSDGVVVPLEGKDWAVDRETRRTQATR